MSHDDSTFMRTFWIVMAGLLALMFIIIVVARMVAGGSAVDPATDSRVVASVNERIKPVGQVRTGKVSASTSGGKVDAKSAYQTACSGCHATGAAGAPKTGDKGAWKKRIAKGKSTLHKNAINGIGAMPPKGGSSLSDKVVKAVVDLMIKQSK